jgi:dipeptidyl-peptidase-4
MLFSRSTLLIFFALATLAFAQKKPVTLDTLRQRPTAAAPYSPVWAPNGHQFAYLRSGDLHLYDCRTRQSRVLFPKLNSLAANAIKDSRPALAFDWQNRRVTEARLQWAPASDALLIAEGGDLFWLSLSGGEPRQLTRTEAREADPKLSPDGKLIAYRIGNDLYSHDIASGKVTRLTHDGSETLLNGRLNWVYPEELDLGTAFWWSPDSQRLAYLQFDISHEMIYPQADLLRTPALAEPERYPQAGTTNADVRLGLVPATGGATRWLDFGETRGYLLARVHWLGATEVAVERFNRIQNQLQFLAASVADGRVRTVFTESDPHWLNVHSLTRIDPAKQEILWATERTGFRHLRRLGFDGKERATLTAGNWEVSNVNAVNISQRLVYYTSTEADPRQRHLYVVNFDGKAKRQLTTAPGFHTISMSPTAEFFLDTHSAIDQPTRQTLHSADGAQLAELMAPNRQPLDEYDLLPTELLEFPAPDGEKLYARLIKPKGFDPTRKYPAIVMVYGGPHSQQIRNAWPGGPNLDQVLAHRGFVIWQVDNRGSGGRGHLWESKLYRNFGSIEVSDQQAGIEYLVKLGFVDPARIGMSGWSYGGYMTLQTMLTRPKLIRAGISGAPVTNWRLYDTIYTERYMGLPQENEAAYRQSSPITHAKNLEGKLMLVHNIGDDNVLFQNMLQMTDALQQAGKHFELSIYPQKSHGVSGPARYHLNEAMVDFFERHLR